MNSVTASLRQAVASMPASAMAPTTEAALSRSPAMMAPISRSTTAWMRRTSARSRHGRGRGSQSGKPSSESGSICGTLAW